MAFIKDDGNYIIKDPEYCEINEDEIPVEDEIIVNENCARLFYHVKQENINSKYIVHTVQASEEPDISDIDNQIHQDYYHTDTFETKRKYVKTYRKRRVGCDICLRNFSNRRTMMQHRLSHDGKTTKRKQKMSENKKKNYHDIGTKVKKPTRDKTSECEICFRTLSSKSNLKRHMAVHLREPVYNRTFKCEICVLFQTIDNITDRLIQTNIMPLLESCNI
ncbi:KRAB [Mytilus coruscus]|uniref:KRAB n=1 Tax=Mytilus coruscus TaxID=42192 RepID=A0A6J8CJZ8_MYTCO|nr:KRAB [Mytilus coruscus]